MIFFKERIMIKTMLEAAPQILIELLADFAASN